ncbi:type II toxin-antitoxin system VapB family antitoxin [Segnochrobactrum spirostomi]|uniref:Uncharacterized protein n=1 Tax=Segnochrobactrum spirostomi TaxID=2608987 RepID=A0A6A7Y9M7_9HYPH|nr:hypothetical protein [Segnochrobactrum spirostomi]
MNIAIECGELEIPLIVDDAEIDRLAERLVAIRKLRTTEIVRQALQHELERVETAQPLVAAGSPSRALCKPAATPPNPSRSIAPSSTPSTRPSDRPLRRAHGHRSPSPAPASALARTPPPSCRPRRARGS